MSRYIDADALIEDFKRQYKFLFGDDSLPYGLENGIKTFPTADVAPVIHAEWVDGYKRQSCSVCHYRGMRSWNYCPNCGAKMEVKE